jgi:hypothetical protein
MRAIIILVVLFCIYSCNNNKPIYNDTKLSGESNNTKTELKIFAPATYYYTTSTDHQNNTWVEKSYTVFQSKIVTDSANKKFELLDVYGNNNNVVVFAEMEFKNDTIKHIILDTLCNYYDEFVGKNYSHSVGVLDEQDLSDLSLTKINPQTIVSVVEEQSSAKEDMDSAIALHKRKTGSSSGVIDVKRNLLVIKAWMANTKTKKFEKLR